MPEVRNRTVIAAPLATVWQCAQDVEGLAPFISDVESITVAERVETAEGLETVTSWVGLLPEFRRKLHWTEKDWWNTAARTCRFEQLKGDFDAYGGDWLFSAEGAGTAVELIVRYEYDVPLIGPLLRKLVLKKVQQSVDRIQEGLQRRASEAAGQPS
ncbi:MAG: DUF2505 family protein [Fimbriimonadaceae bacterium]|nr:DUF2505 family protein [Fimbriimonadaceae bacterium]